MVCSSIQRVIINYDFLTNAKFLTFVRANQFNFALQTILRIKFYCYKRKSIVIRGFKPVLRCSHKERKKVVRTMRV